MLPSLLALVLASHLVAPAPADDKLTGDWKIRNEVAGNVSEMTCTFAQKDADLTGTCVTEQASIEIAGKIDTTTVSWVFKTLYNDSPITLRYSGSLGTDGEIRGQVTVEEFSVTGDFSATRVKK